MTAWMEAPALFYAAQKLSLKVRRPLERDDRGSHDSFERNDRGSRERLNCRSTRKLTKPRIETANAFDAIIFTSAYHLVRLRSMLYDHCCSKYFFVYDSSK